MRLAGRLHTKTRPDAPPGFFECEAAGLEWLRVPGGPEVARVRGVSATALQLEHLASVSPTREAAHDFGRRLAALHEVRGAAFGTVPPRWAGDWFFGPLHEVFQLPVVGRENWAEFFVADRMGPLRRLLQRSGFGDPQLDAGLAEVAHVAEQIAGGVAPAGKFHTTPAADPARVHGDLWSGNLMWTARGVVLIDPAAHTNHPYTDLAMLQLFGCPHLGEIFAAYFERSALPAPTPADLALHQLFPIGMHVVIFGRSYSSQLLDAIDQVLS